MSGSDRERGSDRTAGDIANQIINWLDNIRFVQGEPDRAIAALGRGPDRFIDPGISTEENYEIVKQEFGITTSGEIEQLLRDAPEQQRQQLEREIRRQVEEYGIEAIVDAIERPSAVDPVIRRDVESVLEAFPPDVYRAEIREQVNSLFELLDHPVQIIPQTEVEERRERIEQSAEREALRGLLDRLRRELGFEFADVDEAAAEIRRRIEAGEGVDIATGRISLDVRPGETSIDIPDRFAEWRDAVVRQADRELDLAAAQDLIDPAGGPLERRERIRLGTIRTEDGALAAVDLTEGREALGVDPGFAGADVVDEMAADEPAAEALADSLIDSLEGS